MPWKAHATLAVACPVVMVTPAWQVYGFEPTDWPSTEPLMSSGILLFAWLVAAGMVALEVSAVTGHRVLEARWIACAAHAWIALVGTLPVWLSSLLTLSEEPIDVTKLHQAGINYGLLLVGYLVCLLAGVVIQERAASRLGPEPLRVDERAE